MGSLKPESDPKHELDDSGYVQEETSVVKNEASYENGYEGVQLLDLSDDVLLYILQHCSPRDLKALGYTCPRLGSLVLDRTLWQRVDARAQPAGRCRVRWLLAHALCATTTELKLSGYARKAKGCLGYVNQRREDDEVYADKEPQTGAVSSTNATDSTPSTSTSTGADKEASPSVAREAVSFFPSPNSLSRSPRAFRLCTQQLPRFNSFPSWPEDYVSEAFGHPDEDGPAVRSTCPGPQFTLTRGILKQLRTQCPKLTSLALEYCIIDCKATGINQFPVTLKNLSLRGTKCFNLDKSFLFKIHDYLVLLEDVELSYCGWVEPAALLPLSKLPALARLRLRECRKLTEFVAYASLATRYGFRRLKILDMRGSPVGDSEVSAFGWVPLLEELLLSPAKAEPLGVELPGDHAHYWGDALPDHQELDPWEIEEPEYFKSKQCSDASESDINMEDEMVDEKANGEDNPQGMENACGHGSMGCILMGPVGRADSDVNAQDGAHQQRGEENANLPHPIERNPAHLDVIDNSVIIQRNTPLPSITNATPPNGDRDMPNCNVSNLNQSAALKRRPFENGSGDNAGIENPGPSTKRKKDDKPCSCNKSECIKKSSEYTNSEPDDNSDDDDDSSGHAKRSRRIVINEGASTSKSSEPPEGKIEKTSTVICQNPQLKSKECDCRPKYEKFVRFRQNEDPVLVERPIRPEDLPPSRPEGRPVARPEANQNERINHEPMHKILYVNVGRRLHTMYQLSMPVCTISEPIACTVNEPVDLRTNNSFRSSRQLLCPPLVSSHPFLPPRLDPSSLVTDSAVRRFGRADGENVNFVHIGPNGPVPVPANEPGTRPSRSNLRILSIRGFRHVTNLSLVHLATAAPFLRMLDVTGTGVTERGVENFKSLRPDCEVKFGEEIEKDGE